VLVGYGGKVGYGARLEEALNEVFGAGATTGLQTTPTTPTPAALPSPGGAPAAAGAASPELQAAITDVSGALSRLRAAQQSGDFAGQGTALADLDKAVKRFDAAKGGASSGGSSAPAPSGSGG
jgi:hypothetical protein